MTWKRIYDRWLKEGDLKVLMYLQKIQRYLDHGRTKTKQEQINLIAQIEALLDLTYGGTYRGLGHGLGHGLGLGILEVMNIMRPNIHLVIPDLTDKESIAEFLRNENGARIKPQAVHTDSHQFQTHPLWILWGTLFANTGSQIYRTALWLYQRVFLFYMSESDYMGAATVFIHAQSIKTRNKPLPLLHPHVIQQTMYSNLNPALNV